MIAREKIDQLVQRLGYLEARLSTGLSAEDLVAFSREYAELKPVAEHAAAFLRLEDDLAAAAVMLNDPEMAPLAREEIAALEAERPAMEADMRRALIPKDAADARPAIIEIRPGTGGEEAALFAATLWRMYARYAETRGWAVEILEQAETELGGLKELVAAIRGAGVFASLKFESGVHRVQRVPETESG
ncbi:MAG: PCRF domain-containing protein, partial [Paracoccaceae bacterium]